MFLQTDEAGFRVALVLAILVYRMPSTRTYQTTSSQ